MVPASLGSTGLWSVCSHHLSRQRSQNSTDLKDMDQTVTYISLPLSVGETDDFQPTKYVKSNRMSIPSLCYIIQNSPYQQTYSRVLFLLEGFEETSCHESYRHKEMNHVNNRESLEADTPVKLSCENSAFDDTLIRAFLRTQISCVQILNQQKL